MSSDNFEPDAADLEEAYRSQILTDLKRILTEDSELEYEAAIHGIKLLKDEDETR